MSVLDEVTFEQTAAGRAASERALGRTRMTLATGGVSPTAPIDAPSTPGQASSPARTQAPVVRAGATGTAAEPSRSPRARTSGIASPPRATGAPDAAASGGDLGAGSAPGTGGGASAGVSQASSEGIGEGSAAGADSSVAVTTGANPDPGVTTDTEPVERSGVQYAVVAPAPVELVLDSNPGELTDGQRFTVTTVEGRRVVDRRVEKVTRSRQTGRDAAARRSGAGSFERGQVARGTPSEAKGSPTPSSTPSPQLGRFGGSGPVGSAGG